MIRDQASNPIFNVVSPHTRAGLGLIPDPLDNIGVKPIAPIDQGSVLAHSTKTDYCRFDVLQPEVVPEAVIIKALTSGA